MRRRSVRHALLAAAALTGGLAVTSTFGGTASAAVVSQSMDCGAAGSQSLRFDGSAPATVAPGGTYTVDIAGQPGKVDGAALSNITYSFQAPAGTSIVGGSAMAVPGTGSISSGSFGAVSTPVSGSIVQLKIPGPVPSNATATPPTLRFQLQVSAAAGTVLATRVRQNPAYQFTASSSAGSISLSCSATGSLATITSTTVTAATTTTASTTPTSGGPTTVTTAPPTTAPPVVTTQTWSPTGCGAVQTTVAPPNTTRITVSATGGNGGRSGSQASSATVPGGVGSNAVASFSATGGITLSAIVGCNGVNGGGFANTGTPGGWSSGGGAGRGSTVAGQAGASGGSGGGASAVCSGSACRAGEGGVTPLVVAGGGGGGGVSNCAGTSSGPGGAGGTGSSTAAGNGSGPSGANGGSANGAGGAGGANANGGSANGGTSSNGSGGLGVNVSGGGGGGGYVGGNAGNGSSTGCKGAGGGGGGSSWIADSATSPVFGTGGTPGVVVTFSISTPTTTTPPACTPDVVPFASSADLVAQQYRDFAGRAPTAGEQSTWVGPIATCAADADELIHSLIPADQTLSDARLVRIYHAYFKRAPDPAGFDYWSRQLANGRGIIVVAQRFADSSEFRTTYGTLANPAFVELVYNNVLGRASEPTGKAFWVGRLDRGIVNRGAVMANFSEANENVTRKRGMVDVWRALRVMRATFPSATEVSALTNPILAGTSTVPEAIETIRRSPGYAARF